MSYDISNVSSEVSRQQEGFVPSELPALQPCAASVVELGVSDSRESGEQPSCRCPVWVRDKSRKETVQLATIEPASLGAC